MLSLPFLTKKEDDFSRKTGAQILEDAILELEQEEMTNYDEFESDAKLSAVNSESSPPKLAIF